MGRFRISNLLGDAATRSEYSGSCKEGSIGISEWRVPRKVHGAPCLSGSKYGFASGSIPSVKLPFTPGRLNPPLPGPPKAHDLESLAV